MKNQHVGYDMNFFLTLYRFVVQCHVGQILGVYKYIYIYMDEDFMSTMSDQHISILIE